MYSLVVVLSLLASASFVLAFLHGRRGHLVALAGWMTLLLYTHAWGLYLAAAMACAWVVLWRRGRVPGRDGLLVAGAVLLLYAPWIPTLIAQAQHTAAPWSDRPTAMYLLWIPFTLFGDEHRLAATPLLGIAVLAALRRARDRDGAIRLLAGIAVGTALARLARLPDRARVGQPLLRRVPRPAGARARGDPRARLVPHRGRARGRRGDLARQRPDRGAQQRAHRRRRGDAGDPPRRRRRLHPAGAGARALALPAQRRALRDPARDGLRRARDRLAQRRGAAARRQAAAAT